MDITAGGLRRFAVPQIVTGVSSCFSQMIAISLYAHIERHRIRYVQLYVSLPATKRSTGSRKRKSAIDDPGHPAETSIY